MFEGCWGFFEDVLLSADRPIHADQDLGSGGYAPAHLSSLSSSEAFGLESCVVMMLVLTRPRGSVKQVGSSSDPLLFQNTSST